MDIRNPKPYRNPIFWLSAIITFLVGVHFVPLDKGSGDQRPEPTPVLTYTVPQETLYEHTDLGGGFKFDTTGERPLGKVPTTGGAEPSQAGCRTRLISHNISARTASPSLFVEHYTVSANRPGWDDMNAIWNWFDNPKSQVSSHYIIDWEGNCYLIVPESVKAWTQGNFNSSAISIEFIATGQEPQADWASKGDAGLRKGAKVTAAAMKRNNIPLKFVDPVDCNVPAGYTDHDRLECGNSHFDVSPNFPWNKFNKYLAEAYHGTCYRFQLRADGKVLAQTEKVKRDARKRKMNAFLAAKDDLLLRKSSSGITLKQLKVLCG